MYPVLIVDDEPAIADLIEMTLETLGYRCVKAADGEAAADLLERQRFDLILLDVMLPGVDGFALMDYIAPTGTPVIFLTARAQRGRPGAGAETGRATTTSSSPLPPRRACWRGWTA